MAKKKVLIDTFEQLRETVSPTKIIEKIVGSGQDRAYEAKEQIGETSEVKGKKHTPLDFEKLQKKYADQDGQKTAILRQRLFQLVKSGEEKTLMEKRQEGLEKKRKEAYQEQEKKRRIEEKKKQEQAAEIPRGKVRRSIFTPLKVAKREQAEVKPAAGKQ